MSMDAYAVHLLGLAANVSPGGMAWWINETEDGQVEWCVEQEAPAGTVQVHSGHTLAEALAALLTDLGVEVPERPNAERVAEVAPRATTILRLRDLYAREPLTVIALLEGGDS